MIYFFQSLSLKTRFLGVLLLLFPVLLFWWLLTGAPWALASFQVLSGGKGLPDPGFWYTPQTLQGLFDAWGARGRTLYLTVLWPTDFGLLVSYGCFLTAATLYLLKKANPAGRWYLLPVIPLAAAGFDLAENLTVALALALPAQGWEPVSWAATGFTAAKWVTLVLAVAVLAVGTAVSLIRLGWTKLKAATQPETDPEGENQRD